MNMNNNDPFGAHFNHHTASADRVHDEPAVDYGDPITYCEKMYPEMTAEFKKIQREQYLLLCKKQMDYGPENISLGKDTAKPENRHLSLMGVWFRMNDKMQRILHIINNHIRPNNESIEDSWIDLSNYALISMLVNRNKWAK